MPAQGCKTPHPGPAILVDKRKARSKRPWTVRGQKAANPKKGRSFSGPRNALATNRQRMSRKVRIGLAPARAPKTAARGPPGHEKGEAPEGASPGARTLSSEPVAGRRRPALPPARPAVPSALGGLTSGFGMGPGVPPLPWPPTGDGLGMRRGALDPALARPQGRTAEKRKHFSSLRTPGQKAGRARARPISAARLRRSRALHLRPIDLVVFEGPYRRENSSQDRLPA